MPVISGDDVFSHACLGAGDLATSTKFYDAALAPLGVKNLGPFGDACVLYGKDKPAFLVELGDLIVPRPVGDPGGHAAFVRVHVGHSGIGLVGETARLARMTRLQRRA